VLYGHGLLGTAAQVIAPDSPALVNIAMCATDWIGMAAEDVPNVVSVLQDLSQLSAPRPIASSRGHLNFLFLGR
jgi:hypothetical protein